MNGTTVIIELAGAVALLIWASRMVRTGIERAYGDVLKDRLRLALGNSISAAATGTGLAIALQSATAVALIVSAFVASGHMLAPIGVAVLLGADLGSAIAVRILSHDLSLLTPLFLLAGTIAFRASHSRRMRQWGRIFIGLGLLFLSLRLIGEASDPLRNSHFVPLVFEYLSQDWITAFAVAALMTWLFHSSVAAVLLAASLFDRGVVPDTLILPIVFGMNFGGAVTAAVLTRHEVTEARIIPLGNVAIRGSVALVALAAQIVLDFDVSGVTRSSGETVIVAHLVFNALTLAVGLPVCGPVTRLLQRLLSGDTAFPAAPPARISALRPEHLETPQLALDSATREVIALCDRVELMFEAVFQLLEDDDPGRAEQILHLDDEVDRMHREIKFYLARIEFGEGDRKSSRACQDLLGATIKLEQAADVISHNMLTRARKKHARGVGFSEEGWQELKAIHDEVRSNARLAFNLLVNPDVEYARELVSHKERVRKMVRDSETRHLQRLREGNDASRQTSSIHIDTMRDVKEFNSLMISLAYPVLAGAGMLRKSRLM
ncbi:MAG: Na+ cotransporter [Rhizobiales bacterium]|nr:Na+ cotransporter [Hyphomicrobiales bacterium]MBG18528.1 Na+ cotransporter [Hyphomicrobiales bacterium]|tara:strand:+ start:563 stop:2212 length:1650 start_codon:yes stop_codon:yes gene_type:complete